MLVNPQWAGRYAYFLCLLALSAGCAGTRAAAVSGEAATTLPSGGAPAGSRVDEAQNDISATAAGPNSLADDLAERAQQVAAMRLDSVESAETAAEPADQVDSGARAETAEPLPSPSESHPKTQNEPSLRLDLSMALELTAGQSPQVAFAQERIRESLAQLARAEVLWLPSLRAGVNYNKHEGQIQEVAGRVFDTSRGAFFTGFGANAVGAGSPMVPGLYASFHLSDAIFQPRIATQSACARQSEAQLVTNDALYQTAVAYLDLLKAAQEIAIAEETLNNARRLEDLTGSYARTGEGLASDYDRARTEVSLRTSDLIRAQESAVVASARLAQKLHVDPTYRLQPMEPTVVPIHLINSVTPLPELVAEALSRRPETAAHRHLVAEAVERLDKERYAPLVPSVLLGVSYGGFGGGLGGNVANFGSRFDADAIAYWEVRNLGFGERAARSEADSRIDQAKMRELATLDLVAREVVEASAQVEARRKQIEVAQQGVAAAASSYRRNVDRIKNAQGLPIEVLQSLQALSAARREYLRVVIDYNAAQFAFHRAIGWPSAITQNITTNTD